MPTFLNLTYTNNLVRHSNNKASSEKKNYNYNISCNSSPKSNGILNNDFYAVPFRPRPMKHYRKRLFPNSCASNRRISIDTINSPGGTNKCLIDNNIYSKSTIVAPYTWVHRL